MLPNADLTRRFVATHGCMYYVQTDHAFVSARAIEKYYSGTDVGVLRIHG